MRKHIPRRPEVSLRSRIPRFPVSRGSADLYSVHDDFAGRARAAGAIRCRCGAQWTKDVDATGVDRRVPAKCVLATRNGELPGADLRVYQFHSLQTQVPPLGDSPS